MWCSKAFFWQSSSNLITSFHLLSLGPLPVIITLECSSSHSLGRLLHCWFHMRVMLNINYFESINQGLYLYFLMMHANIYLISASSGCRCNKSLQIVVWKLSCLLVLLGSYCYICYQLSVKVQVPVILWINPPEPGTKLALYKPWYIPTESNNIILAFSPIIRVWPRCESGTYNWLWQICFRSAFYYIKFMEVIAAKLLFRC